MSKLQAWLGNADLTDVGFRFYSGANVAIGARVTEGVVNSGGGWYFVNDATIPANARSVVWNSTAVPLATATEFFGSDEQPGGCNFTLVRGADYLAADGLAITFANDEWPDLTGSTPTLHIGDTTPIVGTVLNASSVSFDIPRATSALLTSANSYPADVQAVLASGSHVKLATGVASVQSEL